MAKAGTVIPTEGSSSFHSHLLLPSPGPSIFCTQAHTRIHTHTHTHTLVYIKPVTLLPLQKEHYINRQRIMHFCTYILNLMLLTFMFGETQSAFTRGRLILWPGGSHLLSPRYQFFMESLT